MFVHVFIFKFSSKKLCPQKRITYLFLNSRDIHTFKINVNFIFTYIQLTSILRTRPTFILVTNLLTPPPPQKSKKKYMNELLKHTHTHFNGTKRIKVNKGVNIICKYVLLEQHDPW